MVQKVKKVEPRSTSHVGGGQVAKSQLPQHSLVSPNNGPALHAGFDHEPPTGKRQLEGAETAQLLFGTSWDGNPAPTDLGVFKNLRRASKNSKTIEKLIVGPSFETTIYIYS